MHAPSSVPIVDLFAGPGGLDVAAEWLGFPAEGVEFDANACATRRRAGLRTRQRDVRDLGPADFPDATVLTGGPPCQTFTVAGTGGGRRALERIRTLVELMVDRHDVREIVSGLDDERTGLVLEPLRWVIEAMDQERQYEAIVLEQVPAVLPVWEAMAEALERVGNYRTATGILRTEQFGVPQTRRRAILMARLGEQPALPTPTHRPYRRGVDRDQGDPRLLPWETMGRTLDRPQPFEVVSNYGTGGDPKDRGRRRFDEPAATVTGKIRRNRITGRGATRGERFTEYEAGMLQTFPHDYPWSGNDVGQQVGNAIPPRLAAHVLAGVLGIELTVEELDARVRAPWVSGLQPIVADRQVVDLDAMRLEAEPAS
ncbi:DNA methylase [Pseudonocardia sp. EC080625-04]|nr:DNA methylase [Pseudonocardia sp. EC080625-04]